MIKPKRSRVVVFATVVAATLAACQRDYPNAFLYLDSDRNGFLTHEEIRDIPLLALHFAELDTNADAMLDSTEFVDYDRRKTIWLAHKSRTLTTATF